jgi:N-methylhydantoinase A
VEGVPDDRVELRRTIDMRYAGQWRSIAVPVDGRVESLDSLAAAFHAEHEREHSYRRDESPVEIYRINLRAVGATQKAELGRHALGGTMPEPVARRTVRFGVDGAVESPVYRRADLPAGATFSGPAVIEQLDSTVLVPPRVRTEVDEWLNIRMAIEQEDDA